MFTRKTFHLIVIANEDLHDNNSCQLHVVHFSGDGGQSNYFGFLASVFHSYVA